MAYLLKRGNVFYLSHCCDGKRERFSTGLRTDVGQNVRKAKELEAEYTLKERRSTGPKFRKEEQWEEWLHGFIAVRYRNKPGTLRRFQSMWRTLRMYLAEQKIQTPRQLTRQHCFDYLEWRANPDPKNGKFKAVHNTAHLELSTLRKIMKEAVLRGFAPANPAAELGISQDEKRKPCELTPEMLQQLESYIERQAEPAKTILWRSYLVARYHGVRLNETNVNPSRDFNPKDGTVTFFQKGGRKRIKPCHPKLVPLLTKLHAAGAKSLFAQPASFSGFWWTHMSKSGMKEINPKACFHSLRVTVQNRLRRAGVNDEIRRAYLSHEKKGDVHEGYSRIGIDELRVCHAPLSLGA